MWQVSWQISGAQKAKIVGKVHKPPWGLVVARVKMHLVFPHISYEFLYCYYWNTYNFFYSEGLRGTHTDALNPFNSKLMTMTPRGGLWTFSSNLDLCVASCYTTFPPTQILATHWTMIEKTVWKLLGEQQDFFCSSICAGILKVNFDYELWKLAKKEEQK